MNLARLSDHPLRVVIINAKRPMGRGTAYGTMRSEHVLNVAARNMSALPDLPSHFLDWLRSRSEYSSTSEAELRELFAPRRVYGDYLSGLLASCQNPIDARCQVKIELIQDEAVDVDLQDATARVVLNSGDAIEATRVVLATGNHPPGRFPSSAPLKHDPRYRSDPWDDWLSRLPPPGGTVVLLGSGLTMVDILLTLAEIGWDGYIVAISRAGRLPKSHFRGIAYDDFVPNDDRIGLSELRGLVQHHCERLRQMSQNPAIAIDKLRPHTQKLWRDLSKNEKEDFLKHDASEWNVTRHRIAASIHSKVTDALDAGRLKLIAATIERLAPNEQQIDVVLRDTVGNELIQAGDLVINCTGPQTRLSKAGLPLFDNLLRRGLVCLDDLDMGIQVDDEFATIDQHGASSGMLYAIGPLLKGSLWETTAVPELRVQAMRVAETLLERDPLDVRELDVIEYYI